MGCINRAGAEYSGAAASSASPSGKREKVRCKSGCSRAETTRVRTRHTHAYVRTHTPAALLFIPRNSRKEKADSIELPTCTKEGPTHNFPPIRGCRPPATGCTHIRIQSSRGTAKHTALSRSLSLFLSLSFSLAYHPRALSPPAPRCTLPSCARSRILRLSYSLSYLFFLFFSLFSSLSFCFSPASGDGACRTSNLCFASFAPRRTVISGSRAAERERCVRE